MRSELNAFLALAFKGWAYGEECFDTNKCIDWSLTYAQVKSVPVARGAGSGWGWEGLSSWVLPALGIKDSD